MIEIDFSNMTYVCPFCGHAQAYRGSCINTTNINSDLYSKFPQKFSEKSFSFYTLECSNTACRHITIIAVRTSDNYRVDVVPKVTIKNYPEYIPEQIRNDYKEASLILEDSPKAAATLLRRCLQGMIHDFWNIHEKNLNAEITVLKDKIPVTQWKAIDALRKIGNIGAHMEKDVNMIIDVDAGEARKLLKLMDLLLEKWYVARHDEEKLSEEITEISEEKESKRK